MVVVECIHSNCVAIESYFEAAKFNDYLLSLFVDFLNKLAIFILSAPSSGCGVVCAWLRVFDSCWFSIFSSMPRAKAKTLNAVQITDTVIKHIKIIQGIGVVTATPEHNVPWHILR